MKRKSDNLLKYLCCVFAISIVFIIVLIIQTKGNANRIDKLLDVIIGMVSSSIAVLVPMVIFLKEKEHEKGQNIENLTSLLVHVYNWIYPRYSIIFRDSKDIILSAVKEPKVPLLYDDSWRNYIVDIKNPEEKKFLIGFFITLEKLNKEHSERDILKYTDKEVIKNMEYIIIKYGNESTLENIKIKYNNISAKIYDDFSTNNMVLAEHKNMEEEVDYYINRDIESYSVREEYEEYKFIHIEECGGDTLIDKIKYAYQYDETIGIQYISSLLRIDIEECEKIYKELIEKQYPVDIYYVLEHILALQNKEKMIDLERQLEKESILF